MRLVTDGANFLASLQSARSEATAAFGNGNVLLERALDGPRHVEVQIFADAFGNVVHLGERDCSVQRRHQKLIEEAPSPAVDADLRERLGSVAIEVARAAAYVGAGTVEFLLDASGAFYFIEMNTRLQVEHPVTEAIFGFDLVEWQLRVARGEPLPRMQGAIVAAGHAIEVRLCAEDPDRQFLPQSGTLVAWDPPLGVRVEHALEPGIVISPYYDSMIAKVIAYGATREDARVRLVTALQRLTALGVTTNRTALVAYLGDERFVAGDVTTRFIDDGPALAVASEETLENAFALAGALSFALAAESGDFGPWTAWSSTALPASTVVLSTDDGPARSIAIVARTARELGARIGERTVDIAFANLDAHAGHARYRLGSGPWQALAFARDAGRTFLSLDGRTFAFTDRGAQTSASGAAAAGDGFLRAPMSGRVVAVSAASGAVAKAGTALVVLEAMKMEHVLSLPIDARFGDVTAAAGMQVHANDILLAYEPLTSVATTAP
jgi:geranyl-CoA carboxylase alpha subunit